MNLHELRKLAEMVGYPTKTAVLVALHDEVYENTDAEKIDYLRYMIWQLDTGKL